MENIQAKQPVVDLHGQTKTITINDKKIVLKKLALGKYALILKALKKLPEKLGDFGTISNEKVIATLPSMIGDSLPEITEILSIATGIPAQELEDTYGLDDVTELVKGIFEVNNFAVVKKNLGSLWKTAKTPQTPTKTG